jgi:hypothetical protein
MFDDFFDFMPPFFGLFRLLQGFVIENLDQVVDRTLHRFGRALFSPVWCGGGQRRRCHDLSSHHSREEQKMREPHDLHVDDGCHC